MEKGNIFLQPGHTIRPGAGVRLQASGAASYTWSPPSGLSCLYCANPEASPAASTRYCVASQENNCPDTACTDIIVTCFDEDRDLSVPNAFSPNGDGENDQFCLQGWEICNSRFAIEIYDRWGEKVFASNDPGFCWNGVYRGELLNAEVYIYLIAASFTDGSTVNRKGNITLLR
jgi:gliding motility-associated-like protein